MTNLRKEAKGRECQVRIVGVCNGNPETVVLAHYRMGGLNGMGMKPDDIFGAWACERCHSAVDGRLKQNMTVSSCGCFTLKAFSVRKRCCNVRGNYER